MRAVRAGHRLEGARPQKVTRIPCGSGWGLRGMVAGRAVRESGARFHSDAYRASSWGSARGGHAWSVPPCGTCLFEAQAQGEEPHLPAWPPKLPAVRGLNLASGLPRPKGEGV